MLGSFKRWFMDRLVGEAPVLTRAEEVRLATAALFVRAVTVDGAVSQHERQMLHRVLAREFNLSTQEASALMLAAQRLNVESGDLFGLTSQIRSFLNDERRHRIIEVMCEIAYSDGKLHEFEDDMISRVAALLGIDSDEYHLVLHVVETRMGIS